MIDKVLSTLGLAKKAGKISSGTNLVSTFIRGDKKPALVLLAQDASNNTKKLITSASRHHKVVCISTTYSMERGFAELVTNKLNESGNHLSKQEV